MKSKEKEKISTQIILIFGSILIEYNFFIFVTATDCSTFLYYLQFQIIEAGKIYIYYTKMIAGQVPKLVNKQFNSPINLYSPQNVQETLDKQTKILANGAVG